MIAQSRWILGGVQLGLDYGIVNRTGKPSRDSARRILAEAVAGGASHVDTARAYGDSEEAIGAAAGGSPIPRVITKIAPLTSDAEAATDAAASLDASRAALASTQLDAVLVHRAADWWRPGVRDVLRQARETGLAAVGASLAAPDELLPLLEDPLLGYVQFPFNLVDRRWLAKPVLAALERRPDVTVTVRSVFLQGLLAGGAASDWPDPAEGAQHVPAIEALVSELGRTNRADLCVAYALGHGFVTSVVLGAETPEQVQQNAALARNPPLTADELTLVGERLPAGSAGLVDPSTWRKS